MIEEWRDIPNYEGLYQVSNFGRIKSVEKFLYNKHYKEKILIGASNTEGYYIVVLSKNKERKTFLVHRLVAEAFVPMPADTTNYYCVGHKDETRTNNCADNLEWVTIKENNNMPLRLQRIKKKHHPFSEEAKKRMSESQKGNHNRLGHSCSEKTKIKMALNAKVTKNASKKVICENQIFNSIQECSMFYNISYGKIAGWLRGDRKMPIEFQEKGLAYYNPKNQN